MDVRRKRNMTNIAEFRNSEFSQFELALATGCKRDRLLEKTKELHGNTQFNSFLYSTQRTTSPIDWLEYEQSMNASILGVKEASEKLQDLEESVGLSVSEIIDGLKHKRETTKLGSIFDDLHCEYWSNVTKGELLPFLKEYDFWLQFVADEFESFNDVDSAGGLAHRLGQPVFGQLKKLADIVSVESQNWDIDSKVYSNILKGLRKNNKAFIEEWLSDPQLSSHYNAKTLRQYQSLYSFVFLSLFAKTYGLKSNLWATKTQWEKLGCSLKEGAKPAAVFHYYQQDVDDELNPNSQEFRSGLGSKVSIVYNSEYVIGFEGKSFVDTKVAKVSVIDKRIDELNVELHESEGDSQEAYYSLSTDSITMPSKAWFKAKDATKAYYATLLHELVHWTGHYSRCNRKFGKESGDTDYIFEELVAEIGSSFLCARFGLTKSVRTKAIQYIASWLRGMDPDEAMAKLNKASGLASKASNFIYLQPQNK